MPEVKTAHKTFKRNRLLLAGKNPDQAGDTTELRRKVRANLHYANMAAMLPQTYAKDPEFAGRPTEGVEPARMEAAKAFARTSEVLLSRVLVKNCKLKKKAKKLLRSAYAVSIGWWKLTWQENTSTDPITATRLKDTQDNIDRIKQLRDELHDPEMRACEDLKLAELQETLAGLEVQQEVVVSRGLVLDFVNAEDLLVLDPSIRTITDYDEASALAQRIWMTAAKFKATYGFTATRGTRYATMDVSAGAKNSQIPSTVAGPNDNSNDDGSLLCVYEIWDESSNRVHYVCVGEDGFLRPSQSPDWTGARWYPFFGGAFNEIDGSYFPLSDIELTERLVDEYNQTREDFARDRRDALPVTIVRSGGGLTDAEVQKVVNRQGGETIVIKGVPGKPLSDDIMAVNLTPLRPEVYDTTQSRADIEQTLGGGDASRGTVMKAKTATEAEIVSQGLRGRSAERQDILEDVLNELGPYALEVMLRKMTPAEVKAIAGPDAEWPQLSIDEIFNLVSIEVRGGSTGKPDRLQEQDRWTKLLPVIKEAMQTIADLQEKGDLAMADAVKELTRETLRRFDERLDIDEFLPKRSDNPNDPAALMQQVITLTQQNKLLTDEAKKLQEAAANDLYQAAASIATAKEPRDALVAFLGAVAGIEQKNPAAAGPMPAQPQPASEAPGAPSSATAAAPTLQ